MEPEGSLPHSQVPATCPYPEPARSSPHPHIPLPQNPSNYYAPIYSEKLRKIQIKLAMTCDKKEQQQGAKSNAKL